VLSGSGAGCKELSISPTNRGAILSRRDCRNWRNNRKLLQMYRVTLIILLLGSPGRSYLDYRRV